MTAKLYSYIILQSSFNNFTAQLIVTIKLGYLCISVKYISCTTVIWYNRNDLWTKLIGDHWTNLELVFTVN